MFNLIVKDLLVLKRQLYFSFVYILFMMICFQGIEGEGSAAVGIGAFAYIMIMTNCAYEDSNKSHIVLNCLPVNRRQIVLSKYLSVPVYYLIGLAAYVIISVIVRITGIPIRADLPTLEVVAGGIASILLLSGLYMPVYFKYGYLKSRLFNFIVFFAFFIGITSLVSFLKDVDIGVLEGVLNLLKFTRDEYIVVIISITLIAFMGISYAFSLKFYEKREF